MYRSKHQFHSLTMAILSWAHQSVQAYLRDIASSVPDHCNKASIIIKQVVILLLVEGPAFSLLQNTTSTKCNKAKYNKMRYACNDKVVWQARISGKEKEAFLRKLSLKPQKYLDNSFWLSFSIFPSYTHPSPTFAISFQIWQYLKYYGKVPPSQFIFFLRLYPSLFN